MTEKHHFWDGLWNWIWELWLHLIQLPVPPTIIGIFDLGPSATPFAHVISVGKDGFSLGNLASPKLDHNKESWFRPTDHPPPPAQFDLTCTNHFEANLLDQTPRPPWLDNWDFRGKDDPGGTVGWGATTVPAQLWVLKQVVKQGVTQQSIAINKFAVSFTKLDSGPAKVSWYHLQGSNFTTPFVDDQGPFVAHPNDKATFHLENVAGAWQLRETSLTQ